MRTPIVVAPLLLLTTLQACSFSNCEKGTGTVSKHPLKIATFQGIAVQGSIEVLLSKGTAQQVEVEAQANLIDLITTEVKGGVWHIGTRKCVNTTKPIIVHITVPAIDHITLQGSGGVKGSGTFATPELTVEVQGSGEVELAVDAQRITTVVQGSGDIELKGRSDLFSATVQGSGDIDADELLTSDADATVQGSGDISVNVSGTLSANVGGSGDITYKGTPAKVNKNINGSGDVERIP